MVKKSCETCALFRRHYIKLGHRYHPVDCGNCLCPELKSRDMKSVCEHYRERRETRIPPKESADGDWE